MLRSNRGGLVASLALLLSTLPSAHASVATRESLEGAALARLGLTREEASLTVRHGRTGTFVRVTRHLADGTPLVGSEAVLQLRLSGTWVLHEPLGPRPTRLITASRDAREVERLARAAVDGADLELEGVQRVAIEAGDVAHEGFRVSLRGASPPRLFEVDVDATTGATTARSRLRFFDGSGLVFDPNPIASAGTSFVDASDATTPALDAARLRVVLAGLDGSGFLRGEYADVHPRSLAARAVSPSLVHDYDRADERFEEVNAYFHLDRAQRFLRGLGYTGTTAIHASPIEAIVHDSSADNSYYDASTDSVHFGSGGVDDAEDGEVVRHEYAHAIVESIVPGFGGSDGGAIDEAFALLFALSVPSETPRAIDEACYAAWNASSYETGTPPCHLRLDAPQGHFPEHLVGEVHEDGAMLARVLWLAETEAGLSRSEGLALAIEALYASPTGPTYESWARDLVSADLSLHAGAHRESLESSFTWAGIFDSVSPPDPFVGELRSTPATLSAPMPTPSSGDAITTLTQAGARAVRVHFASFALETHPSCASTYCDRVYLYDGSRRLYAVLGGALGSFDSVAIPGDTVIVRFVSDGGGSPSTFTIDRLDYVVDVPDGGVLDLDAGMLDAAVLDASELDAAAFDAGELADAGLDAANALDAAAPDAATPDAAAPDAAAPDAAAPDAAIALDAGAGSAAAACGCRAGARRGSWGALATSGLLALVLQRRRRSRGAPFV